jgi:putative FmdB family regulatory protein
MPTYDYKCPNGHVSEKFFRKISDAAAELQCPVCGAVAERQLSGGAGLLFKGSGFYITDYGKDGKKKPAAEKPPASGAGEAKSETKGGGAKGEAAKGAGESKPGSKGTAGGSGGSGE